MNIKVFFPFAVALIIIWCACISKSSTCSVSQSCTLVKNKDGSFMLAVNREHINDTIYNIQKIGVKKENENSTFTWVYVYGTYTSCKNCNPRTNKTGWVHVSDGGSVKVVVHGVYGEEQGSFHGRKDAKIYSVEEGWKKLCN